MKRYLITTMYAAWIGFSMAVLGFNVTTWQFWFVILPTIILVSIRDL